MKRFITLIAVLALALPLIPTAASASDPYPGSMYREEYFQMGDQASASELGVTLGSTTLHADVLRHESYSWTDQQPTVLVVSPYTNHNGSTTDVNPLGGNGPMDRFYDFLDATGALEQGYTFAQVDLPGNGGSSGCNDWGGPVEQGAVSAAVEWVADQPWSNGHVALLGKSYDGWTGLMGMAQDAEHEVRGLSAVISLEPVFSGYRYLYNNGVRFLNSVSTNALFQAIDAKPGALNDDPEYHVNGAPQAYCYGLNVGLQQQDDEGVAFWNERNLVRQAAGSDVPLFLTQGFLETNTKVDAALDFWNAIDHSAGDHKLWIGQFNHVRAYQRCLPEYTSNEPQIGNCFINSETGEGEYLVGRDDFAEQVMVFLDEHLKGVTPDDDEVVPTVHVQDSFGRWRTEDTYPTGDQVSLLTELQVGSYDDSLIGGSLWSVSDPMPHDVWLSGEPIFSANVDTLAPRGNITAFVYDVTPGGRAKLIHQGSSLIRGTGNSQVDIQMYAQDWVVAEGHQLAVEITGVASGFAGYVHVPTGQPITVNSADIKLPFLTQGRVDFHEGSYQTSWQRGYTTGVNASSVPATNTEFQVPAAIETGDHTLAEFDYDTYDS